MDIFLPTYVGLCPMPALFMILLAALTMLALAWQVALVTLRISACMAFKVYVATPQLRLSPFAFFAIEHPLLTIVRGRKDATEIHSIFHM